MTYLKVKDAASRLGITAATIRRLERERIIPPAVRAYNGHRIFSPGDLDRIRAILFPTEQEGVRS